MDISVRLLGQINTQTKGNATVPQRYIAVVTPESLSGWLSFERVGNRRSDRYKLRDESFIQIDPEIQRGRDTAGALLQMPKKVDDIASTLLGTSTNSLPHAFLGTLIWNVRPEGSTLKIVREEELSEKAIPEYRLRINTKNIWLTDSAHRHLGIVEAYRRYEKDPSKYPRFPLKAEFVVEVYSLDRAMEKALFFELNSMQKRISATKRLELDIASSAGFLKDTIRYLDETDRRLFQDNIEVTSNQNKNHTLLTMSVFVSSIQEMFRKPELDEAKLSEHTRNDLAEFYCNFFYKLSDTIVVAINDTERSRSLEIRPFYNLYLDYIQPATEEPTDAENAVEMKLDKARAEANRLNKLVREQDIANHNTLIRALCRLAGKIRYMPDWPRVIEHLQVGLNVPMGNRFFQKANKELFEADAGGIPIATTNENGSLNVQVQSETRSAAYRYLRRKLQLDMSPAIYFCGADPADDPIDISNRADQIVPISRKDGGKISIDVAFYLAADVGPEEISTRLSVDPGEIDWKEMRLTGQKRLEAERVEMDNAYEHPLYPKDIQRYVASFSITVPPAARKVPADLALKLRLSCPDLDPNAPAELESQIRLLLE
jgi:hypothetical protein